MHEQRDLDELWMLLGKFSLIKLKIDTFLSIRSRTSTISRIPLASLCLRVVSSSSSFGRRRPLSASSVGVIPPLPRGSASRNCALLRVTFRRSHQFPFWRYSDLTITTEKKDRNDWFYDSLIGAILPKRGWRQSSYYSGIRELTTTTRQSITRSSSTCSFSCSSSTRSTAASSLGRSMCIVVYLTQGGSRGRLSSTRIQ